MSCNHLKVLELAKTGLWNEAHQLVQPYSDQWSCLLHGYLHRVEGDLSNAQYWYSRAKTEMPGNTLEEEFKRLFLLMDGEIEAD